VVTQLTTPTRATALPSSRPLAAPPPPCSAPVDPLPALTAEQCLEVLCRDRDRRKTTAVLGFTTLVVGIFAFANMLMATSNAPTAAYDSVAHVVGVP
jgi:predicted nucleic acid-binding Zn ribbon protein